MAKASDVAKYIIATCRVDNLKLQKLLYYSQAVHLVLHDKHPLFLDVIEAWQYGPVVPNVYQQYKEFGFDELKPMSEYGALDQDEIASLDMVVAFYGGMSGIELVERTHQEDTWKNAYNPQEKHSIITIDAIYDYFKPRFNFSE